MPGGIRTRWENAPFHGAQGFEEWGRILGDEVMAAALLDRLLHRCHIVNIRGNSYQMRRHAELSKAIHPVGSRTTSEPMTGEATS